MSKNTEAACLAVRMANDPKHGYAQDKRWGPDFDCSSFLIWVWEQIGVPLKSAGASYTGNVRVVALSNGFREVTVEVNLSSGYGLQLGDILLNEKQHMAMFVGNGQLVHASINEKGTVTGGQTGDQTGREICVRSYYNHPWDCVLRYVADEQVSRTDDHKPVQKTDELPVLRRGSRGKSVKAMQAVLIVLGYDCGPDGADGDFGPNTEAAVTWYQIKNGLKVDGECGPETWGSLLGVSK